MISIPIFLSSDNNYAPFVATTIASICDNTKSFCEFYVLDGGITEENRKKIYSLNKKFNNFSLEFINIDTEKEFKNIDYKNNCFYVTISTYNRLLIPRLKPKIKKCIYLDVDLILLQDIKEFFEIPLENYPLGAVEDFESDLRNRDFIAKEHTYFNAGVLLLDCEKWREMDATTKLFELEEKYRDQLKYADQDLLNKYFENNYKKLPSKFNVIFPIQNAEIAIRHYAGDLKPYSFFKDVETTFLPNIKEFWDYATKSGFEDEIIKNFVKTKEEQKSLIRKMQFLNMLKKVKK